MVFLKVSAVVIICAAVWITVHLLMLAGDQRAGVVEPENEKESQLEGKPARLEVFPAPPPGAPGADLRFSP